VVRDLSVLEPAIEDVITRLYATPHPDPPGRS
jgi:hypothetical protein